MRTVVAVSAAEVVRMIAILVLQRPESSGKSVGAIEVHTQDGTFDRMNVMLFDSAEEALGFSAQAGAGAETPKGTAPVLQLVTPPSPPPAPEPAAVPPSDAP